MSDIFDYISVDFDNDSDISLAMERDMEYGATNHYRTEANYFGFTWSDGLSFELHIMKNPCGKKQEDLEITKDEIRQITRWLTSSHYPQWIEFEYCTGDDNTVVFYRGWFNNIETFTVGKRVYGLKLYFKCTTPFGYTSDITNALEISNYGEISVINDSDELEDYSYPQIKIEPKSTGQIYLCNLSDCTVYMKENLILTQSTAFDSLLDYVENYALLNGYSVRYSGSGDFNIVPICNNTAIQFYLVDKYNNEKKCTAFYREDTNEYRIIEGGFVFMDVKANLPVYIDCQKLTIVDDIGRMVTYDDLGIVDVDQMYWFRLINGENNILLYGDATFTITHRESRKVGE